MAKAKQPGDGIPEWVQRRIAATTAFLQREAAEAESFMKAAAPWEDRTSAARAGLTAEVTVQKGGVTGFARMGLMLRHSEEYGVWLETVKGAAHGARASMPFNELTKPAYAGPYAIIHPAADRTGPLVQAGLRQLWGV